MYPEKLNRNGFRDDWQELTELLCDQIAALGYLRPEVAHLVSDDDVLLLLLGSSDQERGQLDAVAPALAELITMDLKLEVTDLGTSVTTDGCRAVVSFILGRPKAASSEKADALQRWYAQVHRNACRQQDLHRQRCREMNRLRSEMDTLRAELRSHLRGAPGGP